MPSPDRLQKNDVFIAIRRVLTYIFVVGMRLSSRGEAGGNERTGRKKEVYSLMCASPNCIFCSTVSCNNTHKLHVKR